MVPKIVQNLRKCCLNPSVKGFINKSTEVVTETKFLNFETAKGHFKKVYSIKGVDLKICPDSKNSGVLNTTD